jgi:hypothetical protein
MRASKLLSALGAPFRPWDFAWSALPDAPVVPDRVWPWQRRAARRARPGDAPQAEAPVAGPRIAPAAPQVRPLESG